MSLTPTRDLREFVALVHEKLEEVLKRLGSTERKLKKMAVTQSQIKELITKLDDEVNKIGNDLQDLVTQLKTAPDAERQEIADQLEASIQKLTDFDSRVIAEEVIPPA